MEYKWSVLAVTTVGILMAGIDSRIVILGLPQVASALRADAEQAIWLTQAYILGSTAALLLIGRITDILGRVKVYLSGFAIFTIGSGLISLGQSPAEVILFRVIQGVGAGILITNSVALIVDNTPTKELGLALGLNQLAFRFGAMAGLTISGIILALLDWRALFYINIPIGIFGILWARHNLRETATLERGASIDWGGFVAFTTAVTAFLLAMTFAAYGIVQQLTVYTLLVLSIGGLAVFIWHERRLEHPLLDLKLLKIREFTGGVTAQLLNAIALGAVLLLLSLYFELILDLSTFDAGLRIIPFEIAFLFAGPTSGKLSDRFGHLPFTTSGLLVTSASLCLFSTVDRSTSYLYLIFYLVLLGVGIGMFSSPNMSSIMGSVPIRRKGIGSALRSTFFNVGFTISLNLAILIMTLTVPYTVVTRVISSVNTVPVSEAEKALFAEGLRSTYLWLAVLNSVAVLPSVLRGKRSPDSSEPDEPQKTDRLQG